MRASQCRCSEAKQVDTACLWSRSWREKITHRRNGILSFLADVFFNRGMNVVCQQTGLLYTCHSWNSKRFHKLCKHPVFELLTYRISLLTINWRKCKEWSVNVIMCFCGASDCGLLAVGLNWRPKPEDMWFAMHILTCWSWNHNIFHIFVRTFILVEYSRIVTCLNVF